MTDDVKPLRFGIPDLDELLGRAKAEQELPGLGFSRDHPTSLCIIGPDGAGKSVLAMHMAAHYLADYTDAVVLYYSIDLSHDRAEMSWNNFGLNDLQNRCTVLSANRPGVCYGGRPDRNPQLKKADNLEDVLTRPESEPKKVYFYDVSTNHAGDMWQELSRIISLIGPSQTTSWPLIIVDSVDNLSAAAGEVDGYGRRETRDGKIARIVELAQKHCHFCLTVGASSSDERPREAYLTDGVVRLRVDDGFGYSVRTVEIEKARGQAQIRGRHNVVIRPGRGSSTGLMENPDDRAALHASKLPSESIKSEVFSSITVMHSLDYLDSKIRAETPEGPRTAPDDDHENFTRIDYLDDLLGKEHPKEWASQTPPKRLNRGSVNAIVGTGKTYKSQLARAFLAQAIDPPRYNSITELIPPPRSGTDTDVFADKSLQKLSDYRRKRKLLQKVACGDSPHFAILLTTDDIRPEQLAGYLLNWKIDEVGSENVDGSGFWRLAEDEMLNPEGLVSAKLDWIESRLTCRRFETHSLYSSGLINIVRSAVLEAREILKSASQSANTEVTNTTKEDDQKASGRIRVVIDDWNTIQSMYPAIAADSRCLEFLIRDLRDMGVTSLIVNSENSISSHLGAENRPSPLLNEADNVLLTWPVISRGRKIVAVSSISSKSEGVPPIRQIGVGSSSAALGECIRVDPKLELYRGLMRPDSEPEMVPLRVLMLDAGHAGSEYVRNITRLFDELFTRVQGCDHVIDFVDAELSQAEKYEHVNSLSYFKTLALDHTLVFLVDEFWAARSHTVFEDLRRFLLEDVNSKYVHDRQLKEMRDIHDLYLASRPEAEQKNGKEKRFQFFFEDVLNFDVPDEDNTTEDNAHEHVNEETKEVQDKANTTESDGREHEAEEKKPVKSIERYVGAAPYTWDFSFVMCRHRAWANARNRVVGKLSGPDGVRSGPTFTVGDVWCALGAEKKWPLSPDGKPRFPNEPTAAVKQRIEYGIQLPGHCPYDELTDEQTPDKRRPYDGLTVEQITDKQHVLRSWRYFLQAAHAVALSDKHTGSKPAGWFSYASAGPESLGSLVLEVWLSESVDRPKEFSTKNCSVKELELLGNNFSTQPTASLRKLLSHDDEVTRESLQRFSEQDKFFDRSPLKKHYFDNIKGRLEALRDMMGCGLAVELYKAIRLLFDPLYEAGIIQQLEDMPGAEIVPCNSTVAVRHIYKTTGNCMEAFDADDPYVPVQIPGKWSTRGDMGLSIARGSRSIRLGEWAIDKLLSESANINRLEQGAGLPTRDLGKKALDLRTAIKLSTPGREKKSAGELFPDSDRENLSYGELLQLSALDPFVSEELKTSFLFRSRISHYADCAVVWRKWIRSMFLDLARIRRSHGSVWLTPFDAYDHMTRYQHFATSDLPPNESNKEWPLSERLEADASLMANARSWVCFCRNCGQLIRNLEAIETRINDAKKNGPAATK